MNAFGRLLQQLNTGDGNAAVQPLDLVAVILLLLLVSIGGVALFFMWLARRHTEALRLEISRSRLAAAGSAERRAAPAAIFGGPARWLAIRSSNTPLIQSALRLRHVQPCTWEEGFATARERRLFVTPPVEGWTLVFGGALPEAREDIDACYRFLLALSHKLGQVQYFTMDRALNHHGWAWAEGGKIVRAYVWAGETLWNEGPETATEQGLSVRCLAYAEAAPLSDLTFTDPAAATTEKVAQLAAAWSLNPTELREPRIFNAPGIAGEPASLKYF
ncbi:hypothetical protein LBMAG56_42630 [Verrucomicrobiota bacterium]|nr:hypothetical protein LBMAG56_42630 [Verrucomicrobiota bacterium]